MILKPGALFLDGRFQKDMALSIQDGKIEQIGQANGFPDASLDLSDKYLVPGLVDLQLNGGGSCFFANDISVEGIKRIRDTHLMYGTTSFLITLTTCPYKSIFEAIEIVREFQQQYEGCLGLHVEGPYLNPEKKGAHPIEYIRLASEKEFEEILAAGKDVIKMITVAPEMLTSKQLQILVDAGICIAAGHSMATYKQAKQSFENGVNMVTHLYNAMSQLGSRAPGLVGATLNHPVYTSIIVDGKHVDYAAIDLAYKLKGAHLLLISDAAFKNETTREFQFGSTKVVEQDGFYYTEEGRLAGSSIAMIEAVQNVVQHTSIQIESALEMASIIPAQVIAENTVGQIKETYDADLLILNEDWEVEQVIFKGALI